MTSSRSVADYLTRQEFEQFERSVAAGFSDLRESVQLVARKVDGISTRGTDWRALIAFASLVCTIILAIGGVVAFALNSSIGNATTTADRNREALIELATTRWTRTEHDEFRREVFERLDAQRAHWEADDDGLAQNLDRSVRTLLEVPSARLDALEAEVRRLREGNP